MGKIVVTILCAYAGYDRALDSVELPSEASVAIKQRLTHFVRSLSTVSVFALCAGRQVL